MSRKIILICIYLLYTGCSVINRQGRIVESSSVKSDLIVNEFSKNNLTNIDFNLIKAIVRIHSVNHEDKFLCSIKYRTPGKYLCSLRSNAGIEAARIFITPDTILINDRINRKLLYGSPNALIRKYGMYYDYLPVLFGDYTENMSDTLKLPCLNGIAKIRDIRNDEKINYEINCDNGKITRFSITDITGNEKIIISLKKFINIGKVKYPELICIEYTDRLMMINIEIERIECTDKNDEIQFKAGGDYEKVKLI